ncbi:uncharacterized protein LOC116304803 [Actinia tenebrosa]|uniref:Uncharacterized protein LOC116304803 n=1 Tax=Actinia tenebrosa TaxID=6105 RepID=A0A6P8IU58_ACTTE|nr:uncharacterized protein LOC116304803 [Actinia tenebrosa]
MFITLLLPLFLSLLSGIINADVVYTNHTTMDDGKYKLWWTFNNATDTFYFKVEAEALGWIGFGITLLYGEDWMMNGMDTYDALVAGVYTSNGSTYGLDYLLINQNRSQCPEHVDDHNDWIITNASEKEGKTILEFNRKRLTNEPVNTHFRPRKGDIQITPGNRSFVWAYHKTIDQPCLSGIGFKHDRSGLQKVVLLPVEEKEREPIYITTKPEVHARRGPANIPVIASVLAFIPFLLVLAFEGR